MLEKVKKVAVMRHLFFCFASLLLSACNATIYVTSQPEGAYITRHSGYPGGFAPIQYNVSIDENRDVDSSGCWIAQGITAQWASGATVKYDRLRLCGSSRGYYTFNMVRPQDAPNLQADLNFAMQMKSQKSAADRASAARAAAALGGMAAGLNAMQTPQPQTNTNTYIMPGGKMMNCTTTGTVTNCY